MLTTSNVHVRWMLNKDIAQVLKIEDGNSQYASPLGKWIKKDFSNILAMQGPQATIGLVAAEFDKIYGFCIYGLQPGKLQIYNMSVDKEHEGCGIGSQLISKLKSKLTSTRRRILEIDVREYNLRAQLFLKKSGFLAIEIIHGWYEHPRKEDAYRFQYILEE